MSIFNALITNADIHRCQTALNMFHGSVIPFNLCDPKPMKSMPDPATRSFTVLDTSICFGPGSEEIHDAM